MKKIFAFVLLAILAIVSSVSAQTCDCENLQEQIDALTIKVNALSVQIKLLENGNSAEVIPDIDSSVSGIFEPVIIGDYTVELIDWSLETAKYSDVDYFQMILRFTNNSDEAASYGWKIGSKAYQDGIELGTYIVSNSERTTDIRPGKSIEVKDCFKLRDKESEIELEFTPFMSYKAEPIVRIINIK